VNFLDLRTEVFSLLGDSMLDAHQFSTAEIDRYINDTVRRMAYESGCLEVEHHIAISIGVGVYDLPHNISRIFRVAYDKERISAASTHELDRYDKGWQERSGLVQVYYLDRLEHDQIGLWRVPDTENSVIFNDELGLLSEITGEIVNFRYASTKTSLGVVVDFTQNSDTVTFAAATSGGGSNAGYGIVVDVSSTEDDSTYTFGTEFGSIVDWDETTENAYDAEIFVETLVGGTDGESTAATEFGILIGASTVDDSDMFEFHDADGLAFDTYVMTAEVGTLTDLSDSLVVSQLGIPTKFTSAGEVTYTSNLGIVTNMAEMEVGVLTDWNDPGLNVEIWAKEDPRDLEDDADIPRLPQHSHQGVAFGAAATALMKNSETRNVQLATVYSGLEKDYSVFLRKLVVRRAAERRRQMKAPHKPTRHTRVHPRLPGSYPRTIS